MQNFSILDDGIELRAVLERPTQELCPLVIVLHGFTSSKDRAHTVAACEAMWGRALQPCALICTATGKAAENSGIIRCVSGFPTHWS